MVSEIRAKIYKLLWKIRKNLLKIICTIGNPEKVKENNINLMEILGLKSFKAIGKSMSFTMAQFMLMYEVPFVSKLFFRRNLHFS